MPDGGRVEPLRPRPIIATLADHGVDYVLIGGLAVAAHGFVRATRDVDICPSPDPENLRRLADALAELEAEPVGVEELPEFELRPDLETLSQGANRRLATRYGGLDVMQEIAGVDGYRELSRDAEERTVTGDPIRVVGYEALVRMKRAAGRDQDLIDIRSLEAARGEL